MFVKRDIGTAQFVTPASEYHSNGASHCLRARSTTTCSDLTQHNLPRGPRVSHRHQDIRTCRLETGFLSSAMRECYLESIGASALVSGDTASHADTVGFSRAPRRAAGDTVT